MFKNPCANRKVFFTISIILVAVSILSMALRGFNFGIDFTGGTTFEIEHIYREYNGELENDIRDMVSAVKSDASVQIQSVGSDGIFIKTTELTNEESDAFVTNLLAYLNGSEVTDDATFATEAATFAAEAATVNEDATEVAPTQSVEAETIEEATVEEEAVDPTHITKSSVKTDKVSATTSARLIGDTFKAVLLAIVLMLIYITIRFDFKSGISAVIALAHDTILMFGFYSLFHITMNTSFVAAVLTIIGYSINATIVVFDRVRENNKMMRNASYDEKADKAIFTSYTRTLYSSLTTLFTIGALFVLGVSSIREFALPIIVGIVCGAYSSLFVAPTFWAFWNNIGKK